MGKQVLLLQYVAFQMYFICNTIIRLYPVCQTQEECEVAGVSPMVSMRIPEDHLLEIDQRVGLDGMRNRSDVIREAVRKYLASPLPSIGDRVEVDLGPDLTARMRDFCKLHGETPSSVLRQAARTHIAKATLEGATVDRVLEMRMDELRARFDEDSNAL